MGKLNPKQLRFCEEYMRDSNGTQAAIRAGYSAKTANEQGSKLLAKGSIQEKLGELRKEFKEETGLTPEKILQELEDLGQQAAAAKQYGPAMKSVELRGKHIGMFGDKLEIKNGYNPLHIEILKKLDEILSNDQRREIPFPILPGVSKRNKQNQLD